MAVLHVRRTADKGLRMRQSEDGRSEVWGSRWELRSEDPEVQTVVRRKKKNQKELADKPTKKERTDPCHSCPSHTTPQLRTSHAFSQSEYYFYIIPWLQLVHHCCFRHFSLSSRRLVRLLWVAFVVVTSSIYLNATVPDIMFCIYSIYVFMSIRVCRSRYYERIKEYLKYPRLTCTRMYLCHDTQIQTRRTAQATLTTLYSNKIALTKTDRLKTPEYSPSLASYAYARAYICSLTLVCTQYVCVHFYVLCVWLIMYVHCYDYDSWVCRRSTCWLGSAVASSWCTACNTTCSCLPWSYLVPSFYSQSTSSHPHHPGCISLSSIHSTAYEDTQIVCLWTNFEGSKSRLKDRDYIRRSGAVLPDET